MEELIDSTLAASAQHFLAMSQKNMLLVFVSKYSLKNGSEKEVQKLYGTLWMFQVENRQVGGTCGCGNTVSHMFIFAYSMKFIIKISPKDGSYE